MAVQTLFAEKARAVCRGALDLLYPRLCFLCGGNADRPDRHICWDCYGLLPVHTMDERICRRCGTIPAGEVSADFLCDACARRRPCFGMARAATPFRGGVRVLLHSFKYNGATWLCEDLVDLLEGSARAHYDVDALDMIVPVPLHTGRLRKRGYNQAGLMAAALARRLRVAARGNMLRRCRATRTQTHLGWAARQRNVRAAFEAPHPEWVRGRTVLLVDDVMTTGATLNEASRALLDAGAWRVWALAASRGL